jgi:hypothetical protein
LVECDTTPTSFSFDFELYGDVGGSESLLSSDTFTYQNYNVRLEDEPLTETTRRIYAYSFNESGDKIKIIKDVGVLTPLTGNIQMNAIPLSEGSEPITINIYCIPASNDVVSRRNNLLQIDTERTSVTADVDEILTAGSTGATKYTTFNRH